MERPGPGPDINIKSERDHGDEPQMQPPSDGAGPLFHREYRVAIVKSALSPDQLVEAFRSDPNRYSPAQLACFVPDPAPEGLQPGDDFEIKIPGPWDGPIRVAQAEPDCIRLETRQGHLEAGRIEFRSRAEGETTEFVIDSFARSGDKVIDTLYQRIGIAKYVQTEMWVQVLEALVAASGGTQAGRIQVQTTIYNGATE